VIPLVLVPGMMCDARLFGPQVAALSRTRAIHHAPITRADDVDDLAAEILSHAPPRFALAGLSMGGIVAMAVVARAPERVAALALLETNPRAETDTVRARREPQIARVRAGGLAAVMREELKPLYLADGPDRPRILDLCMAMALDLGAAVFERQSRALQRRPDRQDALAAVRVPTLVLCGAEDRLCPLERHTLMAALVPRARLAVIEGAGHLPTLEQPDRTTAVLARWLEAA
jgi:pimeloyl-ACP methyl ester carboxylesterase